MPMKMYSMPLADLIKEHKRLMAVLKTGKGTKAEIAKQTKEMNQYMALIKKRKL